MTVKKTAAPVATGTEGARLASIPAATEIDPSGAPVQNVPDADLAHPAVDNDPRKGTTVDQNKIDFNDPTLTGREAVEKSLGYKSGDDDQAK
ncbi:hypothetical protein OE766_03650 [Pararhizobium sp. YC-54]|uniref:hypothetical protein n=1 Tax=Pararhizobium sp. YC-54 TaxID=2986920 RepID=UPI0021F72F6A|nr:hypothetical protein [Pararhizobium sp. YC-54]MCV9997332.1 hypothetical protein [Pararhizobium sp. YC-54]